MVIIISMFLVYFACSYWKRLTISNGSTCNRCVSDILSGSLSPHPNRDKENEHEAKNKGKPARVGVVPCS